MKDNYRILNDKYKYNRKTFGIRLRNLRNDKKELYEKYESKELNPYGKYKYCKTQDDMADEVAVECKTYGGWERGTGVPTLEQANALAIMLDCDLNYLLGGPKDIKDKYAYINQISGIDEDIIRLSSENEDYLTFLNAFMNPKKCNTLIRMISDASNVLLYSDSNLKGINEPLNSMIHTAYRKYQIVYGVNGSNYNAFIDELKLIVNEDVISFKKKGNGIYIKNCIDEKLISEERERNRIVISNYDEFIMSLADYCYPRLKCMSLYSTLKAQISEEFISMIEEYFKAKLKKPTTYCP